MAVAHACYFPSMIMALSFELDFDLLNKNRKTRELNPWFAMQESNECLLQSGISLLEDLTASRTIRLRPLGHMSTGGSISVLDHARL
jgi:hypothetical protein